MNIQQTEFILSVVRDAYLVFKKTQVWKLAPEHVGQFQSIFQEVMKRPMPTCSSCVTEGALSLIIRAEQDKLQIESNSIATDEQPKRRRKK
jgi:hypothetical protein